MRKRNHSDLKPESPADGDRPAHLAQEPSGDELGRRHPVPTVRKLDELKPHPKQSAFFSDPTEYEIQELAAQMRDEGLLVPIEILPDGTIICGHKRAQAAKLLGWAEIAVWIRNDLAEMGEAAVELHLILDNLVRRQMGPLELARCHVRVKQLCRCNGRGRLSGMEHAELRDQIGKRLGRSGRSLDRYLRVAEHTPHAVQNAVTTGTLSMQLAERVASLPKKKKEEMQQEIDKGADVVRLVRRCVGKIDRRHKHAGDAKVAFVKALTRGCADLQGRLDRVSRISPKELQVLARAEKVIMALKAIARRKPRRRRRLNDLIGAF
jgi:ParB/RepB/Spo0J family partition protein